MKLLGLFVVLLTIAGCAPDPRPTPKFSSGQLVKFKINPSIKGMVFRVVCFRRAEVCLYDVRLAAQQSVTNTYLLAPDGPIQEMPISTMEYVREYELEGVTDE